MENTAAVSETATRDVLQQIHGLVHEQPDSVVANLCVERGEIELFIKLIRNSPMFEKCSPETLRRMARRAEKKRLSAGTTLWQQGEPQESMITVVDGRVDRLCVIEGQPHLVDVAENGHTVGAHHLLFREGCFSTAVCATDTTVFTLSSDDLNELILDDKISREIIHGLTLEVRRNYKQMQTPLLEQRPKPTPYFATSAAAGIESFYRSALNAILNARLSGQPIGALFPNMSVQAPTRVAYINGFKGIRHMLDSRVDPNEMEYPGIIRLFIAVAPGVVMTPVSSILEACNAGHMNPEPLHLRWSRGLLPRGAREIVFGLGLNQLSDYFEERVPFIRSPVVKNAVGSMIAGVIAGYFSHVPHNLSTLKLMTPHKPYGDLFNELVQRSENRLPTSLGPTTRRGAAGAIALLLPRGLGIRTTQIVGSFMILNGTINSLKNFDPSQLVGSVMRS